ncbi:MAG: hypothetical protein ABIA11_03095 [Patescibacteria group bacterium]
MGLAFANTALSMGVIIAGVWVLYQGWGYFLIGCNEKKDTSTKGFYLRKGASPFLLGTAIVVLGTWLFPIIAGKEDYLIPLIKNCFL